MVNILDTVRQGQQLVDQQFQGRAQRQAGMAFGAGDFNGAARALGSQGDIRGAMGVQQWGQEQQTAQTARQLQFTKQAVQAIGQAQDPLAEYDRLAPVFQQMGTDPAQIAQMRQALQADPQGFLQGVSQVIGQEERKLQYIKQGEDIAVIREGDTQPLNVIRSTPQDYTLGNNTRFSGLTNQPIAEASRDAAYMNVPDVGLFETRPAQAARAISFDQAIGPLLQREGGYVARDGASGAPANFGINQRANPDVDVQNLTQEQAAQLYKTRYWDAINADNLPPEIREIAFDAAVNHGPQKALQMVQQSGGDPNRLLQLREAEYRRLAQNPDYAPSLPGWINRLEGFQQASGGTGTPPPPNGMPSQPYQVASNGPRLVVPVGQPGPEWQDLGDGLQVNTRTGQTQEAPVPLSQRPISLTPRDEKLINETAAAAQTLSGLAADARRFVELNRSVNTGGLGGLGADLAGRAGNPATSEMRAIVDRMAPAMREAGSGAMSDRDVAMYRNSVVGLNKPGPTNQALAEVIAAGAQRTADRLEFLESWAQKNRTLLGAQSAWMKYANSNPLFDSTGGTTRPRRNVPTWQEWTASGGAGVPAQQRQRLPFEATPQQIQRSQEVVQQFGQNSGPRGSSRNPILINPAQATSSYNNIRQGQYYIAPDGQLRKKGG